MADEKPPAAAGADDAAYQAELKKHLQGDIEALGIKTEKKEEEKPPEEPPEKDGSLAESEEEAETEEGGGEEGEEEKPDKEDKYSKAFRRLQKEEAKLQEFKGQILVKERELQQQAQRLQQQEGEIASFIKQLRINPAETLFKAGILNKADARYMSQQLYYLSPEAESDPKNREHALRLQREREAALDVEQTKLEVERLRREREEERQQALAKQNLDAYTAKIEAAVEAKKSKSTLLAKAMEKNPTRTRQELFRIANDLSYAKQAFADPGLVILAWEKERKAFLAELGINEPVKKPETDKSKTPDEKRGIPNGKPATKGLGQYGTPEFDQAAYDAKLKRMLSGDEAD